MAPLAQAVELFPGLFHLGENSPRVDEELLAGLRKHDGFAQPVQKTTLNLALEGFDRVADRRLRQMQFSRGSGEGTGLCQGHKRAQLPAVERRVQVLARRHDLLFNSIFSPAPGADGKPAASLPAWCAPMNFVRREFALGQTPFASGSFPCAIAPLW